MSAVIPATERGFHSVSVGEKEAHLKQAETLDYSKVVGDLRATFRTGKTKSLEWRKQQLRQLQLMIKENYEVIVQEFRKDHGGPKVRGFFEIAPYVSAQLAIDKLDEWAKPTVVPHKGAPLDALSGKSYIKKEPKGVVLIIAPWNYPISLTLDCMIAALCAGNCILVKPSEVSANSCAIMAELFPKYFDQSAIRIETGGVAETTAILRERYDHIIYTGNGAVARIVMAAAARHLTPCTLELGGKSPTYVDKSAKIDVAVARISGSKWLNAGQTCIAPDYVLVHKDVAAEFTSKITAAIGEYYGKGEADIKANENYGKVINSRHVDRVNSLLKSTSGKILAGGECDKTARYHSPTIVQEPSLNDSVMQEEIFGPVLPIIAVDSVEEAVEKANTVCDHPLALYIYAEDQKTIDYYVNNTTSGGVCVNSCIEHISNPNLPFGGVGESGMGRYHGKFGFDECSHWRGVFVKDTTFQKGFLLPPPPYGDGIFDLLVKMQITGFLTDTQRTLLKVGGAAAVAALAMKLSSRI